MVDYFENSIFILDKYKLVLNEKLDKYFKWLGNKLEAHNVKGNIYLTGSLARKEPSIGINDKGEIYLASDIDFILGVEKDFHNNEWLMDITRYLNEKYPEFISSVVLTKNDDIKKIKSRIGYDLEKTIHKPIYQKLPIPVSSNIEIGIQDYIDNIINQMACYFLHPNYLGEQSCSILYKDINNHYIKLVLESLSAVLYVSHKEPLAGFYEIYNNRYCQCYEQIASPDQIEQLLQARELKNVNQIPAIDIHNLITFSLKKLLKEKYDAAGSLFELIRIKDKEEKSIYNTFQVCVLCFMEYMYLQEVDERKCWLDLLLNNMNCIAEIGNLNLNVKQLQPRNDQCNTLDVIPMIIYDMREIRKSYIRSQYFKNTDVDVIPDLNA